MLLIQGGNMSPSSCRHSNDAIWILRTTATATHSLATLAPRPGRAIPGTHWKARPEPGPDPRSLPPPRIPREEDREAGNGGRRCEKGGGVEMRQYLAAPRPSPRV